MLFSCYFHVTFVLFLFLPGVFFYCFFFTLLLFLLWVYHSLVGFGNHPSGDLSQEVKGTTCDALCARVFGALVVCMHVDGGSCNEWKAELLSRCHTQSRTIISIYCGRDVIAASLVFMSRVPLSRLSSCCCYVRIALECQPPPPPVPSQDYPLRGQSAANRCTRVVFQFFLDF